MRCAPQAHGAAREALASCPDRRRSKPTPPPTTRWCSPTQPDDEIISGGNFHGAPVAIAADLLRHRARATRDDQRAAIGSPRQSGAQRPAGVPDARQRAAVGLHDGAGDRRGARLGDQDARASRERGHDPDVGQPGRSRQHEHGRGAQGVSARSSSPRASSRSRSSARAQAIDLLAPLRPSASRCSACMRAAHARADARSTIVRRRPTSRRSPDDRRRLSRSCVRRRSQVRNFSISN